MGKMSIKWGRKIKIYAKYPLKNEKKCLFQKEQAFEKSTVMIGDTKHDESAAEKIRIDFIGVSYGFGYKKGDQLPNKILVSSTYELYDIFLT